MTIMSRGIQLHCRRSILLGCLALMLGSANADDFSLDPAPMNPYGNRGEVPYKVPTDPQVCRLYLENLRYFARRNTPLSCERPVAPHLRDRIQKGEWEDLNPAEYPQLYRALVATERARGSFPSKGGTQPEQTESQWEVSSEVVTKVRNGTIAFRRAKLALDGFPDLQRSKQSGSRQSLWLVQWGPRSLDSENPDPVYRCKAVRGGPRPSSLMGLKLYLVSDDMKSVFGRVLDVANGGSGEAIRLINGRPYVETATTLGNVIIMEINADYPRRLDPVCAFLYRRSDRKE